MTQTVKENETDTTRGFSNFHTIKMFFPVFPVTSAGYKTNPSFSPKEVSIDEKKCNDKVLEDILIEVLLYLILNN